MPLQQVFLSLTLGFKENLRSLGLTQALSGRIIEDIYAKGNGLL